MRASGRIFVAIGLWTAVPSATAVAEDRVTLKEARLVRALIDGRSGVPKGSLTLSRDSAFLWLRLEVPPAVTLPVEIEFMDVDVADSSGQRFKVIGISSSDEDQPVVQVIWEPVSHGGTQLADVTTYATSSGDSRSFMLNKGGPPASHSARLTIKKAPTGFAVFFAVAAKAETFAIYGLPGRPASSSLTSGKVSLPTPPR